MNRREAIKISCVTPFGSLSNKPETYRGILQFAGKQFKYIEITKKTSIEYQVFKGSTLIGLLNDTTREIRKQDALRYILMGKFRIDYEKEIKKDCEVEVINENEVSFILPNLPVIEQKYTVKILNSNIKHNGCQ